MSTVKLRSRFNFNLLLALILALTGAQALASGPASHGRFLTGPNEGDPLDIARQFLSENHTSLGLTAADLENFEVSSEYVSAASGTTHIALQQRFSGIRVFNAAITINIARDGSVINVGNRFISDLANRVAGSDSPELTAEQAVTAAASHLGLALSQPLTEVERLDDIERTVRFSNGGISRVEIPVHLTYQLDGKVLRLAWEVEIHELRSYDYWSMRVDARSGEELDRFNMTIEDDFRAQPGSEPANETTLGGGPCGPGGDGTDDFCVYAMPVEAPHYVTATPDGSERTVESDPWTASSTASPLGWNDLDGNLGADTTATQGNNAFAQKSGTPADGGANRIFNFSLDLGLDPTSGSNVDAAIANLYYWNNILHDLWSDYGFDEAAGNFQEFNYSGSGSGSDSVTANAQAPGNCNANFSTPSDGSNPTMNMFTCNIATPSRDGDLDNGVIAHEYWHGISNRLTGGPSNTGCLNNSEQAGEGWSDLGGLLMSIEAGDTRTDARGIGTWLLGEGPDGPGVRTQRYSTDFAVNNHTYVDIGSMAIPHGVGEVWASIVWEVVWDLIDTHGFNPDFYAPWNTGGNNLANQLIIDGLKLQPCSPGFVDARDAIIAADQALTGGANECLLWTAFARRGLGFGANQGTNSVGDEVEAFDLPPQCLFDVTPNEIAVCSTTGNDAVFSVDVPASFFAGPVTLSSSATPGGASIGFSTNPVAPPGTSTMTVTSPAADYSITVTGDDGLGHLANETVSVVVSSGPPGASTLLIPADGSNGVSTMPTLEWAPAAGATEYYVEVATDPAFSNMVDWATTTGTSHAVSTPLSGSTLYYWRVITSNGCGAVDSAVYSFTTAAIFCNSNTVPIPDNDPAGAFDPMIVGTPGPITDLDISIQATHTWVGDLIFTLTHDDTGTSVIVFDRPGVPASTFGCSDNDIDLVLDDEGTSGPIEDACPANTGLDYVPEASLSAFDGEDLAGTWTLSVEDAAGGDTGEITGWCLLPSYVVLEPEITVSPTALGFGDQPISSGATGAQAVTITNDGSATLNLSSVSITGGDAGQFGIATDTGEASLAPAATRTITITFDPDSIGPKAAALTVVSDDADEPSVEVDLTGNGLAPNIDVSPTSILFTARIINTGPGDPEIVTITNLGTSMLSITDVSLTGADAGQFNIESDTGEATLAPAANRTVTLNFEPTTIGSKTAALTVDSDDPDQPSLEIGLGGKGANAGDILFQDGFETGDRGGWGNSSY